MKTRIGNVWFITNKEEDALIDKILARTKQEGIRLFPLDIQMSLIATHSNGCTLDFNWLLNADRSDFIHDICGIEAHLNRNTGKLEGWFAPHCAIYNNDMPKMTYRKAKQGETTCENCLSACRTENGQLLCIFAARGDLKKGHRVAKSGTCYLAVRI